MEKANAAILFEDDFDGYADSPANHGWLIPTAASMADCDSPNGGRCLKFDVQATGTAAYSSFFDPNPNGTFSDGYIAFWAKEENHTDGTAGGVKWLKLFSADFDLGTYANVTFGQEYTTGQFYGIATGNGFDLVNDIQGIYRYSGNVAADSWFISKIISPGAGAGYGTNKLYTCKLGHTAASDNQPGVGVNWPTYWDLVGTVTASSAPFYAGDGWHYYEYYMKHNTNGNYDGELAVWVDGQLKIRAAGLRNRNDANSMDWDVASLVNHVENAAPSLYQIYFDDIKTSDSYIEMPVQSVGTYSIDDFIGLSSLWSHLVSNNNYDINIDGIINIKDLGIMMSKWN